MTLTIEKIPRPELGELLSCRIGPNLSLDEMIHFNRCIKASTTIWQANKDGKVLCIWGLIPPTLMDVVAYMWLHIIEPVGDWEFVLVRHSQKAIAKALEEYPTIIGHCDVRNPRAIRWIKWLGGTFGHPEGRAVPFTIQAKEA